MDIGKKIVIVGVSASGKSTFALKLSEKIGLPVIHMDAIMWRAGWDYVGDEKTDQELAKLAETDEWLLEGYITTASRTVVFRHADTIIHLDYPGYLAAWRYIQRWWKHRKDARPELEGCPEKFSFKFLKLVWTKGEGISLKKFLKEVKDQKKIVTLSSPKEAKYFLSQIKTSGARKTAGGVVLNARNEVLVVSQNGDSWSLPKGGVDEGETTEEAARREIREESGVRELTFVRELGSYTRRRIGKGGMGEDPNGEEKHITMFLYTTTEEVLQPEDQHNPEARWVSIEEVGPMLTYPKDTAFFESIKEVLKKEV